MGARLRVRRSCHRLPAGRGGIRRHDRSVGEAGGQGQVEQDWDVGERESGRPGGIQEGDARRLVRLTPTPSVSFDLIATRVDSRHRQSPEKHTTAATACVMFALRREHTRSQGEQGNRREGAHSRAWTGRVLLLYIHAIPSQDPMRCIYAMRFDHLARNRTMQTFDSAVLRIRTCWA
eukprot:6214837-Pleurochrysis_carterae.AAC.10